MQHLLVSALLHDIGKFWQRTGEPHSPAYPQFDRETYGCSGAHAKWSADFIERAFLDWAPAAWTVPTHHFPRDFLGDLRAVTSAVAIDPDDDPFAAAREALLEAVRREQARG